MAGEGCRKRRVVSSKISWMALQVEMPWLSRNFRCGLPAKNRAKALALMELPLARVLFFGPAIIYISNKKAAKYIIRL
jgi:hypothetical protein